MSRLFVALSIALAVLLIGSRPVRAQDIECDPGDREVRSLDFFGNHAFTDDELAVRIVTTASTWARRHLRVFGQRRCLDSDELARDRVRLQLLYRYAGYYNAKVDTLVTPVTTDEVNVAFIIDEGQPVRITRLTISGLDSVRDRDDILRGLWVAVGKPYDYTRLEADLATVLSRLQNAGYPRPDVLRNIETSTRDSLTAHVDLTFLPGPLAHIGAVNVSVTPNSSNKPQEIGDRIVRKLLGIGPGDVFRSQSLIDAQRNVYQTGAYRYVEVTPVVDSVKLLKDSTVDLQVKVIEDYMRDVSTEFGWATLDCFRARAQIVDKNFLGGAQRLELTGQASKLGWGTLGNTFTRQNLCYYTILKADTFSVYGNYSVNATVRQPALFGTWATPSFSLYSERRSEYKAYLRNTYVGGEASLLRALSRTASLRVGYNIEYGNTKADPTLLCAAFSRCDTLSIQQIQKTLPFAILSVAAARVEMDNPINPTQGWALRAESRNSATFFGSSPQLTFIKGVGDGAWYHPLPFGHVVSFRVRLGSIWGGADAPDGKQPPQQERLYAGGASSVRGFQQNELGALLYVFDDSILVRPHYIVSPAGDSSVYFTYDSTRVRARRQVPVGGNTLFVANFDYRLPSPVLPNLLQFTLFGDMGTVFNRQTHTNFGGFRPYWTPGVGVRVFSPLGPIQVNAGYNPYPPYAGQALYTPVPALADIVYNGVYCAVPDNFPPGQAPLAVRTIVNGNPVWNPDQSTPCPRTYQAPRAKRWVNRLTFTFSIGSDF